MAYTSHGLRVSLCPQRSLEVTAILCPTYPGAQGTSEKHVCSVKAIRNKRNPTPDRKRPRVTSTTGFEQNEFSQTGCYSGVPPWTKSGDRLRSF